MSNPSHAFDNLHLQTHFKFECKCHFVNFLLIGVLLTGSSKNQHGRELPGPHVGNSGCLRVLSGRVCSGCC